MNEKTFPAAGGKTLAAATVPAGKPAVVSGAVAAVPVVSPPVVQPVPAPAKPPAAFGGHRGGGKKRADGLVAGSPEAKAADREKDAARKKSERTAKALAALPPPLPGVAAPGNGAAAALPLDPNSLSGIAPVPGTGSAAILPTFVAWSSKMLERPVKLLSKIADRFRVAKLMARVRKLGLGKELEAEAEKRMSYKAEQLADFNAALTNCAVIELNRHRVYGAEHSHWLELVMTGGELVNCHLDMVDWLEKQILAQAAAKKKSDAAPVLPLGPVTNSQAFLN